MNFRNSKAFLKIFIISGLLFSMANAQANLFDSPWRGFDTGTFNEVFAPTAFAAGDIDSDGDADVVVGNRFQNRPGLSVLKNRGDGNYDSPVIYQLPFGESVGGITLSDFDTDGDLDTLATIPGGNSTLAKIYVWRNNGDGSLAARVEFPTGGAGPMGIVAADFTGDSFVDVVTANSHPNANNVSLLRHNGETGAAAAFVAPVNFAVGSDTQQLAAADLNDDGNLDLAVGHLSQVVYDFSTYTVNTQGILLNMGGGNFSAATIYIGVSPPTSSARPVVALADVNNDGKVDLIGGATTEVSFGTFVGVVSVRRGNGDGTFNGAFEYRFPSKVFTPRHLTTTDLNGDGFLEIIAATPTGRQGDGYVVLMNDGAGNFPPQGRFYEAGSQTVMALGADADRDGDNDVLTIANSSAVVTVHKNPGNGVFFLPTRNAGVFLTDAIESADIDGDGDKDIVASEFYADIFRNNGNGTFAPVERFTPPRDYDDMKLRDLNGDGKPDMLFGPDKESPPYHFSYALNNGNGTFQAGVVVTVGACGEGSIDAFDLDADGDLDVVLTEEQDCFGANPQRIFIFRNDGAANFTRVTPDITLSTFPVGIGGADVTGDGRIDLITSLSPGGIGVLPGNGNLTFGTPIVSSTSMFRFQLADFNRDGKLDAGMILYQNAGGTLQVGTALGNGNGTFQSVRTRTGASVLENLRISNDIDTADVNGDQRPDLIVTNESANDISVFLTNADGSLQLHQRYGAGYVPALSTVNDFTGDGKPDIATPIGLLTGIVESAVILLRNVAPNARKTAFDFDGDGKTDVSIFRPSAGEWWMQRSSGGIFALQFGNSTDRIVPGDYTGDGKADVAVWRPASGEWFILRSEDGSFYAFPFGTDGDIPVPADYDGDGKTDAAVFRPSNSVWYIQKSSGGVSIQTFGQSGDKPTAADYDGDNKDDIAIFRPQSGEWWIQRSSTGAVYAIQFGGSTDLIVPADYTGDGKADIAVFRPLAGEWLILRSEDNSYYGFPFGTNGDKPVPADYDGDGKTDAAVFRPSNSTWFIQRTSAGILIQQFGISGDKAIPNAFVP